ncbi:DUF2442 domain-containing protein [Anaerovorax odorimutans]|nr:DUF2442 domain-containing protein [Anaerovorax odorimutans]
MTMIIEVHPREDYQLEVRLTNGGSITLNLKTKLERLLQNLI